MEASPADAGALMGSPHGVPHNQCPTLAALHLTAEQWQALRRQGFVRGERRGARMIYKLRFRSAGRQHVKVLGNDPQHASRATAELAQWQRQRRGDLRCRSLKQEAAEVLRNAKARLAPLVEAAGLKFHGRAIRRPRQTPPSSRRKSGVD